MDTALTAMLTFSDICIDSQYSEIKSRSLVDLTTDMGNFNLKLPVFSANMPYITEYKMATEMANNGGFGIIHRFMSIEENVEQFIAVQNGVNLPALLSKEHRKNDLPYCCGVSIGVGDADKERFVKLYEAGAKVFCIDIAHGHCLAMKETIQWIRNQKLLGVTIIAGNIATGKAALDMAEWGANIVKCGIGPGSVCKTRSNTGVGKPQFSAIKEVSDALDTYGCSDVKIIADGGISSTGDIAKALIYADAVMVGSALAGTSETPGNVYPEAGTDLTDRRYYKLYGGSASAEAKNRNGQESRFVEGEMKKVPFKGRAKYILREIEDGLKSAYSYTGATNSTEYKAKVKWHLISDGGRQESKF